MDHSIEAPTDDELAWVADHVALARTLADDLVPDGAGRMDADRLDSLWSRWLESDPSPDTVNSVINAVGLAFGQLLVDDLGLAWAVVIDESGAEMAVHGEVGDLLIHPPNLVAKRWESRETGFLRPVYDHAAEIQQSLRGPAGS